MSDKLRTEVYHSEIYGSDLVLIGTLHNVDPDKVYNAIQRFNPNCICFELGLNSGLAPSRSNEHKGIKMYEEENPEVELKPADVEGLEKLLVESSEEGGFRENRVKKMVHSTDFKPGSDEFEDEVKRDLGKMESEYPKEYDFFVVLRNMKMKTSVENALKNYNEVVLVVGAGHLVGIKKRMNI